MRLLNILLCVFMTVLAILPCQDEDAFAAESIQTVVYNANRNSGHKGEEACPPFCSCSCCSSSRVWKMEEVGIQLITQTFKANYPHLEVPAIRKQSLNIWQPPKLA